METRLPESDGSFKRLTGSTAELFQALDHLSDFSRIKVDVDQVGEGMFQSYLDRTTLRLNLLLSNATKSFADVVNIIDNFVEIDSHPNLKACRELMDEARKSFGSPDATEAAVQLTIPQMIVWRDGLRKAVEWLGVAGFFFLADALAFPEWTPKN